MTHPNPVRPARWPHSPLVRGLGALLALLALVVGPPLALLAAVGNPIPEQTIVDGQLTDAAIIGLLAGVVWLAWAQLAVVVTVEAAAAARGYALPRILPGCGFTQHFARRLVVTASLLLAGTGPLVAATAGASPAFAATAVSDCRTQPAAAPTLRPEIPPTATERVMRPATATVTVASVPQLESVVSDEEQAELWYVVRPPRGHHYDSLWDIAERHLGDGLRWREIYDLNRRLPQADGQRLDLARLIQPGWRLLLPAAATGLPTEQPAPRAKAAPSTQTAPSLPSAPAEPTAARAHHDLTPADSTTYSLPQARRAADRSSAGRAPSAAGASSVLIAPPAAGPTLAPSVGSVAPVAPTAVEVAAQDDDVAVPFGRLTLGLGAVACAGLVAELARRRRRTQRFRRPGERLPRPSEPAAAAERQVRAANAELTVADLRDALRLLAAECRAQGRTLPDVHAVTLNASGAALHLAGRADPVSPFLSDGEKAWRLDNALLSAADRSDLDEQGVDPYPALVSLGVTDDAVLLVNLEAAGTLTLVGPPAVTTPMLHALIAELGTSLLSATAHLVLTGCPPDLAAMLDHGRVTVLDSDRAEQWADARGRDVSGILHAAGVSDVDGARAQGVADDVWAPAVLLVGSGAGAPEPAAGVAVVRVAESAGIGWALRRAAHAGWTLDPLGIELTPQRLDFAAAGPLAEALETAETPATLPEAEGYAVAYEATTEEPMPHVSPRPANPDPMPAPASLSVRAAPTAGAPVDDPGPLAPRVLVLGSVEVLGVDDGGAPGRKRRATELVAYLALHPGATQYQLDEALWPGARVSRNTRNPLVSRTRQWLGSDAEGQPYLGLVGEGGRYNLAADFSCDWHDFSALAKRGLAGGPSGIEDLVSALDLVRGRPFIGVHPATYCWAETVTQDMISEIVDVAHALAERALAGGDYRRARWAVTRGLAAEPVAELLYADGIRAASAAGDPEDVRRLTEILRRRIGELDLEDDLALSS